MVQQLLHVVNGKEMLSVHGDDDGVPDLRDKDLGFVLYFHVRCCQDLGVDALRQTREDVPPWSPDRRTNVDRSWNGEDGIDLDVEQVCVQEEENQVRENHEAQCDLGLIFAQDVTTQKVITLTRQVHNREVPHGITE